MSALDEARDVATTDLGPLPLWGWAVALVGGIYLSRLISGRTRKGATSPVGSAATAAYVPSAATAAGPAGPATNDLWRAAGLRGAIASGASPLTADRALSSYLAGDPVSPANANIVEQALQAIGLPPNPPTALPPDIYTAPPTVTAPAPVAAAPQQPAPAVETAAPVPAAAPAPAPAAAPAPAPAAAPPAAAPAPTPLYLGGATSIVTVRPGDTLSAIAARHGTTWQQIFALSRANRNDYPAAIGPDPNLIHPGEKVLIP